MIVADWYAPSSVRTIGFVLTTCSSSEKSAALAAIDDTFEKNGSLAQVRNSSALG